MGSKEPEPWFPLTKSQLLLEAAAGPTANTNQHIRPTIVKCMVFAIVKASFVFKSG